MHYVDVFGITSLVPNLLCKLQMTVPVLYCQVLQIRILIVSCCSQLWKCKVLKQTINYSVW